MGRLKKIEKAVTNINYIFVIILATYVGFLFGLLSSMFTNSITDWIMASCTIGILLGTYKAANYAQKSASYSRMQMKANVFSEIESLDEISKVLSKLEVKLRTTAIRTSNICLCSEERQILNFSEVIKYSYYQKKIDGTNKIMSYGINELSNEIIKELESKQLKLRLYAGYNSGHAFISLIDEINTNIRNIIHHYDEFRNPVVFDDHEDYSPILAIKDVAKDIPIQIREFECLKKEFENCVNNFYNY